MDNVGGNAGTKWFLECCYREHQFLIVKAFYPMNLSIAVTAYTKKYGQLFQFSVHDAEIKDEDIVAGTVQSKIFTEAFDKSFDSFLKVIDRQAKLNGWQA